MKNEIKIIIGLSIIICVLILICILGLFSNRRSDEKLEQINRIINARSDAAIQSVDIALREQQAYERYIEDIRKIKQRLQETNNKLDDANRELGKIRRDITDGIEKCIESNRRIERYSEEIRGLHQDIRTQTQE